jgi:hypothetical protein
VTTAEGAVAQARADVHKDSRPKPSDLGGRFGAPSTQDLVH